jgi:hypothetical protein
MVMENMLSKEVLYFKNFNLSPTGIEMLRGKLNTVYNAGFLASVGRVYSPANGQINECSLFV